MGRRPSWLTEEQEETLVDAIKLTCRLEKPLPSDRKYPQRWNCFNCNGYKGTGPKDIVDHCKAHPDCKAAILQKASAETSAQTQGAQASAHTQAAAQTHGAHRAAQTAAQSSAQTQGAHTAALVRKSLRRSRSRAFVNQPSTAKRSKSEHNSDAGPSSHPPSSEPEPEPTPAPSPSPVPVATPVQVPVKVPVLDAELIERELFGADSDEPQQTQQQPIQMQADAERTQVWKQVESYNLKARDESGQKRLLEQYQPDVSDLMTQVQQGTDTMQADHLQNALHMVLKYHMIELPKDEPLLAKVKQVYSELEQFVLPNTTVVLTEQTSASAKVCHEHMRNAPAEEFAHIQHSGYFMACLGPHDNIAQEKLLRALDGADRFCLEPQLQTIDQNLSWIESEDSTHEVSLKEWIIYGLALDKAIDCYGSACNIYPDEPSELQRYCLRAALLGKAPKGIATLYDPNVSLGMRASRNELLRSQAASLHDTVGLPSFRYDQEVHDNGTSRIVADFDIGDAANANSRAATSWSLGCDEAMGEALRRAADQHTTYKIDLTEGVHIGVGITSLTYTFTPVHSEDMLLGAVNDLLFGAHKVWAFVPPENADCFVQLLETKYKSSSQMVFCKELRPMLTVAECRQHNYNYDVMQMQDVGVKLLFQPPGYTVFSLPGRVFHWTMSLGFSLAEAANFYTSLSNISLSQVQPVVDKLSTVHVCGLFVTLEMHMCLLQLHTDWLAEVQRAEQAARTIQAKSAVKKRADLVTNMVDSLKLYNVL